MRVAICDDNKSDRAQILAALQAYLKARNLAAEVKTFDHPDSLLETVRREDFDVYLLDILMPMVSGIDTVRELRTQKGMVPVVFFTTSREYAIEAFGVKAIDYILKPWTPKRFAEALDAAFAAVQVTTRHYLTLATKGSLRRICAADIIYVELAATANYVRLHLADRTTIDVRSSLKAFAADCQTQIDLVAVGRMFLVNPRQIGGIEGAEVHFLNGERLVVPKSALKSLREAVLASF